MRNATVRIHSGLSARLISACAALVIGSVTLAQQASAPAVPAPRLLDAASARALGYQVGWQSRMPVLAGGSLQGLRHDGPQPGESDDHLFVWDDEGVIMRVDPTSGELRWQSASVSSKGGNNLIDVNVGATSNAVMAVGLGDSSCLTLDARTGVEMGQTPYRHIPVTASIRSGTDLVFGSRAGHVIWVGFREERVPSRLQSKPGDAPRKETSIASVHTFAYEERAHQLKGAIRARPVAVADAIVACSTAGQLACFARDSRNLAWQIDLPGGIVTEPATDGRLLYVACRDQYLRCIEIQKGRTRWKWFCESPLENPPLLAGDLVMLQVPELGLVALPSGDQGGLTREPKWKSAVAGNPITRLAEGVMVWDGASSTLSLVDDTTGIVRDSRKLEGVRQVISSAAVGGDLYLMAADGRVQRCKPLTPAPTPAPKASEAPAKATDAAAQATGESTPPAASDPAAMPGEPSGG